MEQSLEPSLFEKPCDNPLKSNLNIRPLPLQPSLSMDGNTVETLLIKNEGDFISVEQGKELNANAHARKRHSQQLPHPPHASQLHQHQHHPQQQQVHGGAGGHAYATDKQHKRDENMRQLLDVTNTLTIEELRDFEMR